VGGAEGECAWFELLMRLPKKKYQVFLSVYSDMENRERAAMRLESLNMEISKMDSISLLIDYFCKEK
jgi:hypothetical protein